MTVRGRATRSRTIIERLESKMKVSLTVRYISGREEKFETDLFGGAGAEARFKEFLKCPNLALQTATELILIPASAIESLSVVLPKDEKDKLNLEAVRSAKRLK